MQYTRQTYTILTTIVTQNAINTLYALLTPVIPIICKKTSFHRTCTRTLSTSCIRQYRINNIASTTTSNSYSTTFSSLRSSSSSFQAPAPPISKGVAIFPDIDISKSTVPTQYAIYRNNHRNSVFVVNGSSRGIGLQIIKSLVEHTNGTIIACCRTPPSTSDVTAPLNVFLSSLTQMERQRIDIVQLDVEKQETIDTFVQYLHNKSITSIDGLFNVAGLLGDGGKTSNSTVSSTSLGPERSLLKLDRQWLEQTFQINVIGHVMIIKALQPFMKISTTNKNNNSVDSIEQRQKSFIINISARVGSISDNELGGWYSYRMSKAALNQLTRTVAHEFVRYNIHVISVHPGTTNTDLSKPFQSNVPTEKLFPVTYTVQQILTIVDRIDNQHSGGFYDWSGTALPF